MSNQKLLSNRVHFTSLRELVEDLVPEWKAGMPDFVGEEGYKKLRESFFKFGEILLQNVIRDVEQGAAKGIQEALTLITDPTYYETKRKRRKRDVEAEKAAQFEQQQKRQRWERGEYTPEEREVWIGDTKRSIKFHEEALAVARQRLLKLESTEPLDDLEIEWPENLFDE